jgi:hypothetical protein
MTSQHPDSAYEVPEADMLEQRAPVGPTRDTDDEASVETAVASPRPDDADEADLLEQREVVPPEDDEDYPHEG